MLSIKDYAKQKNISYEAVRQSVKRYEKELENHVFVQGKTRYLDDFAMDFLDQKRSVNPVVIYEVSKDEEIDRLKKENDSYLKKITSLQEQLLLQKDRMVSLEAAKQVAEKEKQLAITEAVSEANKLAEEDKKAALEEKAKELKKQAEIEKSEADDAAKKEKDDEFEPVRKELEEAKRERDAAKEKLAEPISLLEWFKTRGRKI